MSQQAQANDVLPKHVLLGVLEGASRGTAGDSIYERASSHYSSTVVWQHADTVDEVVRESLGKVVVGRSELSSDGFSADHPIRT